MHADLGAAIAAALQLDRAACVAAAAAFTWDAATSQFLAGLAPIGAAARATLPLGHSSAMIGRIGARARAAPDRRRQLMETADLSHHISRRFNEDLERVRSKVLGMGGFVEQQLHKAITALVEGDSSLGESVALDDYQVNNMEVQIDEDCSKILATRAPAAGDLRVIVAIIKTITDLERIGDEGEKIGYIASRLATMERPADKYREIKHLGRVVSEMVHDALDAFARMDVDSALRVARQDRLVDEEYEAIQRQSITFMMEDPRTIRRALDVMWVVRSLERIGDHAKNISEYVIYMVHGKDIRHTSLDDVERELRASAPDLRRPPAPPDAPLDPRALNRRTLNLAGFFACAGLLALCVVLAVSAGTGAVPAVHLPAHRGRLHRRVLPLAAVHHPQGNGRYAYAVLICARCARHRRCRRPPRVRAAPAAGFLALLRGAAGDPAEVHPGVRADQEGAHRQRGVRRGQLALPRPCHARVGAHLGARPWRARAVRQPQASRFASTLTYMRCRRSISATRTHSFTLWIDSLMTPSSTTSAPSGAMKRPSEVPPPVVSFGRVRRSPPPPHRRPPATASPGRYRTARPRRTTPGCSAPGGAAGSPRPSPSARRGSAAGSSAG